MGGEGRVSEDRATLITAACPTKEIFHKCPQRPSLGARPFEVGIASLLGSLI